jgi:hypothetical protein
MSGLGVTLEEEDASRLAAMLNDYERGKLGSVKIPAPMPGLGTSPQPLFAKVTSGTPLSGTDYPAVMVYRDGGSLVECESIRLRDMNGAALENGKIYQVRYLESSATLEPYTIFSTVIQTVDRYACVVKPTGFSPYLGATLGYRMTFAGWSALGLPTWTTEETVGIIDADLFSGSPTSFTVKTPVFGQHYQGVLAGIWSSLAYYAINIPPATVTAPTTNMTTGGSMV